MALPESATQQLARLPLPSWVLGRHLEEDVDQDGDPMVRVWLDVHEDFDAREHPEIEEVEDRVTQALRDVGVQEWIMVSVRGLEQ